MTKPDMTTEATTESTQMSAADFYTDPRLSTDGFSAGRWQVFPARHEIRSTEHQDGVALEPRLMKLLCLLAARPGDVFTRDELIEALWPRVIVNENSLTRAVSDLRKHLATLPDSGVSIHTIPKRGYVLEAQVRWPLECHATQADLSKEAPVTAHGLRHRSRAPASTLWQQWTPPMASAAMLALSLGLFLVNPGQDTETARTTTADPVDLAQLASAATADQVIVNGGLNAYPAVAQALTSQRDWNLSTGQTFHLNPGQHINEDTNRDATESRVITQSVLAPEGRLMAFIEVINEVSHLRLRATQGDAEPWTAFTTDENISHLQWSPLGDGVLFTVSSPVREPGDLQQQRLMLLDIDTLALHELYRKVVDPMLRTRDSGKLT